MERAGLLRALQSLPVEHPLSGGPNAAVRPDPSFLFCTRVCDAGLRVSSVVVSRSSPDMASADKPLPYVDGRAA